MQAAGTQGARKEYNWTQLSPEKKELWKAAAINGWSVCVENQAIEVLSLQQSQQIRNHLARRGELDRILQPLFGLTDKHDSLRTASHPLPIKASSRMVVPGYKDKTNLEGHLRRDAPRGSRLAQHFSFSVAAFFTHWLLIAAPCRVLKRVFGRADAPREW